MYSNERLVILDADGTTIDAFSAITSAFSAHGMDIGDLHRFQKRRNMFKYLGGLKEFPRNLRLQIGRQRRKQLIDTLTEVYREQTALYAGMADFINTLAAEPSVRVGVLTRNITVDPIDTLQRLYSRNGVDTEGFDFFHHIPLKEKKIAYFESVRKRFEINPARSYACGDEKNDYLAAVKTGVHPFMVSYGFENHERLVETIGVPEALISDDPQALINQVLHALQCPVVR